MKAFAELYAQLDATTSSNAKLAAMRDYFEKAAAEDAAWAVYFLSGGRPRQLVPTRVLREQAMTLANLPEWLFEESYQAVGDLAETLSLLLPQARPGIFSLAARKLRAPGRRSSLVIVSSPQTW